MTNNVSNARLKASLEELARFGCPVDLSVALTGVENEKVQIEQVGGIHESHIFELEDGVLPAWPTFPLPIKGQEPPT